MRQRLILSSIPPISNHSFYDRRKSPLLKLEVSLVSTHELEALTPFVVFPKREHRRAGCAILLHSQKLHTYSV